MIINKNKFFKLVLTVILFIVAIAVARYYLIKVKRNWIRVIKLATLNQWYSLEVDIDDKKYIHGDIFDTTEQGYKEILLGQREPESTIIIRPMKGRKYGDIVSTSSLDIICVSHQFISVLQENNITGWKTYDQIEVYDRKKQLVTNYKGLSITGRIGKIQLDKAKIRILPLFKEGLPERYTTYGLYPDESEWDGSDMCIISDSRMIVVNEKVYNAITEANLSHIEFIKIEEWEYPGLLKKTARPFSVSNSFLSDTLLLFLSLNLFSNIWTAL